jgi:hypothetical protein
MDDVWLAGGSEDQNKWFHGFQNDRKYIIYGTIYPNIH